MVAFSTWKDREIGRQSVRFYGLAGGDDGLLTDFKNDIAGKRNSLVAMGGGGPGS